MKPIFTRRLLFFFAFFLLLSCGADTPQAGPLDLVVSTAWLAEHLDDPDLVTLHIGPAGSYEAGHIPNARQASLRKMLRVNEAGIRDEMPLAGDLSRSLAELGVDDTSRVVVYFSNKEVAVAAARYLLTLEYAGMAGRVAYLDGGLQKWIDEKRPVSSETPVIKTTNPTVNIASDVIVETEWLRNRIDAPGIAVVDGRPPDGYSGLTGHWDRLGHIPGTSNAPYFLLLADNPPYILKSRNELADIFRNAGMRPGDTVVVYCGTGILASLTYLAARSLGYDTRLYDGSFQEWSTNESLPVEASPNPGG